MLNNSASSLVNSMQGLKTDSGGSDRIPRLETLCCRTIVDRMFVDEGEEKNKLDISQLYACSESAKQCLIPVMIEKIEEETMQKVIAYAEELLMPVASQGNWGAPTARSKYFRNWNGKIFDNLSRDLKLLVFAELLKASLALDFDTLFCSIAASNIHVQDLPLPPRMDNLKRLIVREGLYDISPGLVGAAPNLVWLELEQDDVVHQDGTDFLQLAENQQALRHLVLRRVHCGDSNAAVQRSFQRLRAAQLTSLSIVDCDDFPLAHLLGFLLKRLEVLTTFRLSASGVPTSVFGNLAACDNLTHISLRGSQSISGSQLVILAKGCYHILMLDLADSSVDSKKLHKLALWIRGVDSESPPALQTLNLSGLRLTLHSVLSALQCTPTLRVVLLERAHVFLRDPAAEEKQQYKLKRKVKKKDSNKPKPKHEDLNAKNKGKKTKKAGSRNFVDEEEVALGAASVTELYMSRISISDWCAAQIIAHCPDLEKLEASQLNNNGWNDAREVSVRTSTVFKKIVWATAPADGPQISFNESNPLAVALWTRSKLRHLNLLCTYSYQHAKVPIWKLIPTKPQWPLLETLLMPHPRRFLLNFQWAHLTTLVLSTTLDVPAISNLKSLQRVAWLNVALSPPTQFLWRFRHVPRIFLVRCVIDSGYFRWISEKQAFWTSADCTLREIVLFDCTRSGNYALDHQLVNQGVDTAFLVDGRLEKYQKDCGVYSDAAPKNVGGAPSCLSPRDRFFLKSCFPQVKHVMVESKDDFQRLWGTTPRMQHPEETLSDPPMILWEFGRAGDVVVGTHDYDHQWNNHDD